MAGKHGGARAGAGCPKGTKTRPRLEKEAAQSALRQIVLENLRPLTEAQIANALGIRYLVVRDKRTGKFLRVGEDVASKTDPNEETVEIWEKDPSIAAFTDLMDRSLDKPKSSVDVTMKDDKAIEERLKGARRRTDRKKP